MAEAVNFGAVLSSIPQTAIRVLTNPKGFFRELPKLGGYVEPLIFVVVLGAIAGAIQMVGTIITVPGMGIMMALGSLIFMPVFIAIGSFIGAAIIFVIWKLMGSQENYETAYRSAAYLAALSPITTAIGLIPYLGTIVSMLIGLYYIVIVSVEVHAIPEKKAWMVFGILTALICLMSLSATYTARKMTHEMGVSTRQMEEAARAMQKQAEQMQRQSQSQPAPAGQPSASAQMPAGVQLTPEQQKQLQDAQRMLEDLQKQQQRR